MVDFPIAATRRRAPARLELKPKMADGVSLAVAVMCVALVAVGHFTGAW